MRTSIRGLTSRRPFQKDRAIAYGLDGRTKYLTRRRGDAEKSWECVEIGHGLLRAAQKTLPLLSALCAKNHSALRYATETSASLRLRVRIISRRRAGGHVPTGVSR